MPSLLPNYFGTTGEGASMQFDWYDFSTGTGYKEFYATKAYTSGAEAYKLLVEAIPAATPNTTKDNAVFAETFDFTTQTIMKINGIFYIQVPIYCTNDSGGGATPSTKVELKLYKVVDTTATQIGYTISGTWGSAVANGGTGFEIFSGESPTNGLITIHPGEKLRLLVSGTASGTGSVVMGYCHQPSNTGTTSTILQTKSIVSLPFKVDL